MENASKALIMVAGMLLAILIISLLIYAWSLFSKYQSSKDELADIEDVAKFNEQFADYDRDGVLGYEILSLVNKVSDYNYRKSNSADARNDENRKTITLEINMGNETTRKKLTKNQNIRAFRQQKYIQSNTVNALSTVISEMQVIEDRYGGSDYATKIAKGIDGIFLSNEQLAQNESKGITREESWKTAIKKFNSYSNNLNVNNQSSLQAEKENAYKYYEYVQFKRAKFKCTSCIYDQSTSRISKMVFEFTGKLY